MLAVLLINRMSMRRRATRRLTKPKISEKKEPEISICRTCLSTENLVPIFESEEMEEKRSEEFRLVTGLEIKLNDGLSQKICNHCIEFVQAVLQFRRKSRKAEKALLNMTSGVKVKKKYSKRKHNLRKSPRIEKGKAEVLVEDCSYDFFDADYSMDYDCSAVEDEIKPKVKESKAAITKVKNGSASNVSSYQCGFCSKEFRMKATYKAHMRFHTNYCVCESCGKRCRNNNQLQEHKRARHGLGRIHKCAYCDYTSATKEALTIHERRHTGERPYVCDHCGATFHRRSNLVQHIAIHLPEKNFQCDLCPKRLKSRKFLQIHKHNAHTGKRYGYLCPVCEHRFEKPNKFLDKKHVADTEDSIEENETREDTQQDSNLESPINPRSTETVSTNPETQPQCSSQVRQDSSNTTKQSSSTPNTNPSRKRKNAKTNEDSYFDKNILEFLTKNSEIIQNDDMAFFYSLLPLTRTFDNRQKVMFRTAVMNKALEICNCPSSITPLASPMYASTSRPESSTSSMNIASPESLPSGSQDIVLYSVEEPSSQNVVRTNPNIAHTSQNSVITSLSASSFNIPSPGSRDIVLYSVEEPSFQNVVTTNRNFAYTSTSQNL
ncbi:unnamed protein product [Parnassius apollo]|uniref:(apollo) hypothetical protein n=1 Tax=Parnassius apollo TaxID=110799 RepID=A0A8S3XR39_PARAO|nr:unnamed protein product [Parnassius apollo]